MRAIPATSPLQEILARKPSAALACGAGRRPSVGAMPRVLASLKEPEPPRGLKDLGKLAQMGKALWDMKPAQVRRAACQEVVLEQADVGALRGWHQVPPWHAGHFVSIALFAVVLGLGLLRPRFWRMLASINRFNEEAVAALDDPTTRHETLGDYVLVDFIEHKQRLARGSGRRAG